MKLKAKNGSIYSKSPASQPNHRKKLVQIVTTYSQANLIDWFLWTCLILTLLPVIFNRAFRGLALHLLIFQSFSTGHFVDLLCTYLSASHSQPHILWTCFALTYLPVIHNRAFRGLSLHLLIFQSFLQLWDHPSQFFLTASQADSWAVSGTCTISLQLIAIYAIFK